MSIWSEVAVNLSTLIVLLFNISVLWALVNWKKTNREKRTPGVSVIVAAWNEGPRIERCVSSIVEMDYPRENMELIVVGGGTDDTSSVCKRLAKKGLIRFIEEKRRSGKWFALNTGIENAKYDYLAFTDADGVVDSKWLKNLSSYRGADIVVSPALALHDDGIVGRCFSVATLYLSLVSYGLTRFFKARTFCGVGSFMKKSVAKKIRFKKSFVEDYRFCQEAMQKGYRVSIDLEAPVYPGRPKTFADWRKCYLRLFHGFLSEMIFLKDPFSILIITIGMLALIGTVIWLTVVGLSIELYLLISLLLLASSIVNLFVGSRIYRSGKYLRYYPYLVLFYIFVQIVGIESFFRWILKRNIGWPIYNKT